MPSSRWLWLWGCLLAALPAVAQTAPRPVAHWPLEGLAEGVAVDVSGGGHDAKAVGKDNQLPSAAPGMVGQALKFTAAHQQYLEIAQGEKLANLPAFTVMAWLQPGAREDTYEIIGNKGDKSGPGPWPGWRLRCAWTMGHLQIGTAGNLEPIASTSQWALPARLWSHLAGTYDGRKLQVYVNSNLLVEVELTEPMLPAKRTMVIGNYVGRKDAYALQGLLDEVKVYDRVLTAEEIFAAATEGMP